MTPSPATRADAGSPARTAIHGIGRLGSSIDTSRTSDIRPPGLPAGLTAT